LNPFITSGVDLAVKFHGAFGGGAEAIKPPW